MKKHILNTAKKGEIWSILLEEGDCGWVRIFRGGCLGVLPVISKGLVRDVSQLKPYPARWFFGFGAPPTEKTEMIRIGLLPFPSEDEAWPPPQYLPPDMFKDYFQILDKGFRRRATEMETKGLQKAKMVTPTWLRQFILDHRDDCAVIEGGGQAMASTGGQPDPNDNGPTLLEIVFHNTDFPFPGRDVVEDPLAEALEEAGVGLVTGGGSGLETCAIDVEIADVSRGLEVIRQTLRELGCPASTEIHQYLPEHVIHRL